MYYEPVGLYFPDEYSLYDAPNTLVNEGSTLRVRFPYARYFIHQHVKYMWSKKYEHFQMLTGIERGFQLSNFHQFTGYPSYVQDAK